MAVNAFEAASSCSRGGIVASSRTSIIGSRSESLFVRQNRSIPRSHVLSATKSARLLVHPSRGDWCDGELSAKDILLFLLGRFEDLQRVVSKSVLRRHTQSPYLERAQQTLVYTHHGTGVVKLSAVVGRAEQGHELSFREKLVAVFHDLVSTADEIHVVLLQEPGHDIRSKREGHTTIVFAPSSNVLVGIRPEEVAE